MISLWVFFYLAHVYSWNHDLWWAIPFFVTGVVMVVVELFICFCLLLWGSDA